MYKSLSLSLSYIYIYICLMSLVKRRDAGATPEALWWKRAVPILVASTCNQPNHPASKHASKQAINRISHQPTNHPNEPTNQQANKQTNT